MAIPGYCGLLRCPRCTDHRNPFLVTIFTDAERDKELARGLLEAYGATMATVGALVAIVFGMGVLANEGPPGQPG